MAILDFLKNHQASQQQPVAEKSQEQKPETAKQMYGRQAAQEKAHQKPMSEMPPDQKAKVEAIKEKLESSTQQTERNDKPLSHPSKDSGEGPEAARQKLNAQDKTAPALSPTSA